MLASKKIKHSLSNKKLKIVFGTKNTDEILTLDYALYNHDLIDRWIALWKLSEFEKGVIGATNYSGQIIDNEDFVISALNALIMKINKYVVSINRSDLIIHDILSRSVSQKILNNLHRYFEIHSFDLELRDPLKNTFRLLNLFIHRMENFSDGKKNNCLIIEVSPAETIYLKLNEQDFKLFDRDWVWGELLLNYATLGVPTLVAFQNDSTPTPQRRFSAGVQLSFVEDFEFLEQEKLNQWLIRNSLKIDDPKNSVGFIPLGILTNPQINEDEESRINFLLHFKHFTKIKKMELTGETTFLDISDNIFTGSSNELGIA